MFDGDAFLARYSCSMEERHMRWQRRSYQLPKGLALIMDVQPMAWQLERMKEDQEKLNESRGDPFSTSAGMMEGIYGRSANSGGRDL